jgi:biopolymer transport protein ExbD
MGMSGGGGSGNTAVPYINVTPLIDVLLVLLIIFMVISPQKPHKFETKAPEKPPENQVPPPPDPLTLVVSIPKGGGGFKLNQTEASSLAALSQLLHTALDGRPPDRKAVFVKAPNATRYGQVVDVIDVIKEAGGSPIGLQLEGLDE